MGLEKEDIMALIAILQKGLTDDDEELQYTEAPKPKSKPKSKTKGKTKTKAMKAPKRKTAKKRSEKARRLVCRME